MRHSRRNDRLRKAALNTGYSVDIQEALLDALNMRDFIDGYISSESVPHGRPEPYMINDLMTRFNIDIDSAVKLVVNAIKSSVGGEIFVPKILSYRIMDIVKALQNNENIKILRSYNK